MADYWKSQDKKFCDFCKCWIADNKPSIEFHEKGKRHKENVTQRLKQISRQSLKDHKEKLKINEDIKKMEAAALQAYLKDVEANADYTSQLLNKELNAGRKKVERKKVERTSVSEEVEESNKQETENSKSEITNEKLWYEANSDEGYTYYWNTQTGESVWEPPVEGYVSLEEQKKMEEKELEKEAKNKEKEEKKRKAEELRKKAEKARQRNEEEKSLVEERRAYVEREKMKSRAKKDDPEPPRKFYGPLPRGNPYGKWTAIKPKVEKSVDLQLPEQKQIVYKAPELLASEARLKFKEKSISTLCVEGNDTVFKKRKLNISNKKNMRQRMDDD